MPNPIMLLNRPLSQYAGLLHSITQHLHTLPQRLSLIGLNLQYFHLYLNLHNEQKIKYLQKQRYHEFNNIIHLLILVNSTKIC